MRLAFGLTALLLLAIPLQAADWISLRSEHFQLYGNASERELRDVALRLEQFREVVTKLNANSLRDDAPPVVTLIFRDDRSFRPFMPRANGRVVPASGVFVSNLDASYIALSLDTGEEAYRGIFHEFSHYLLRDAFPAAPIWFNEGLAEYYSTLQITGGGRSAEIGRPHEPHIEMLRDRRLPLTQLFGITRNSAEYTRDTPERNILYAQSWLLVHHALHGVPQRRDQLVSLARRMAAGGELAASLRETYGMSVADLERELQTYLRRPIFQYTQFAFTTNVMTRLDSHAKPADEAEVDARLGGLAANLGNIEEASRRLERALKAMPDAGYVHASMGLLRQRQGRREEANAHLQKAYALGGLATPPFVVQRRLTESEARAAFPEVIAKLESTRPATAPEAAPARPNYSSDPTLPEPRTRLLLRDLKEGEQFTFGTIEAIECRAGGIVVVLRTASGSVRAAAASFAAVDFVTFRSTSQASVSCGTQPPAPARLTWRKSGGPQVAAVAVELLPDGYVP